MFLESIVEKALKDNVATAVAVSVVDKKDIIKRVTAGKEEENGREIDARTLFDLASLTKVIFTAPLVLKFAEQGKLSLKDSLNTYLDGFPEDITILSILLHVSGIVGYLPLYKNPPVGAPSEYGEIVKEKITLRDAVDKIRLYGIKRKPFKEVEYSCMGYILLGAVLEKVSGKTLQALAEEFFSTFSLA
jgi:CubicO group peptidase (beta-lactamase class C family)